MSKDFLRAQVSSTSQIASATTAAEPNTARISYVIFNLGTNPLFVKEGASATTSDFSYVLAAGSSNDNGTGGAYESPSTQVYTGVITIAGTSPRYVIVERQLV